MKKTGVAILWIYLQATGLCAQSSDTRSAGFQLSFIPPLSTQGTEAAKYVNAVSWNVLAGVSGSVTRFSLSSLGMYVVNDVSGVHLSGLGTIAGQEGKGVMVAGILNKTRDFQGFQMTGIANVAGHVTGIQFSGLANYNSGSVVGLQSAGLWNLNEKSMVGLQFSSLGNVNRSDLIGFQFAGLSNLNNGSMVGFQFATLSNINRGNMVGFSIAGMQSFIRGDMTGNQIAGVVNTVKEVSGFQVSGLVNAARNVSGFQVSGLVNVAENVSGFQVGGLVNRAKNVSGFQFAALVNVAERNDYPVGIVNIVKYGGERGLGVSYNETGSAMLSFRSGGRILYGIIGVGFNHKASKRNLCTETGFGGHIPLSARFRINSELKTNYNLVTNKDRVYQHTLAVMPAFKITPKLELFVGPTLNHISTENPDYRNLFPKRTVWKKFKETRLQQMHIGFSAGTQLIF
jgi:hypothetical protein